MVAMAGTGWVLAPCLVVLESQLDAFDPDRDTTSDGSIGDARHQAESYSDHNPRLASDGEWYVTAVDVTNAPWLDDWILNVLTKDTRVKYLIRKGRYWQRVNWDGSGVTFQWVPYNGTNPHDHHVHISVRMDAVDDKRPWAMPTEEEADVLSDDDLRKIVAAIHRDVAGMLSDPYHFYLPPIHKRLAAVEDALRALALDPAPTDPEK